MIKIITVNFNQSKHLKSFTESVPNNGNLKVYVVDNSGELSNSNFTNTIILHPKKNLGYLKGLEYGIVNSDIKEDDFIILCNPDLIFNKNFFKVLLNKVSMKKMDLIAPSIINSQGNDSNPNMITKASKIRIVQYDIEHSSYPAFLFIALLRLVFKSVKQIYKKFKIEEVIKNRIEIFIPHGACMILKGSFFQTEKRFKYDIFLWGEEAVIANEVRKRKGKIIYDPSLVVTHNEGSVTSSVTSYQKYLHWNNSYKIIRKYLR